METHKVQYDKFNVLTDLIHTTDSTVKYLKSASRCIYCKGSKLLCGKARCPILVRYYASLKTKPYLETLNLDGSSPPSVFVGRFGYPTVKIGPLVPPLRGDTSLLDTPELWLGRSIDEVVEFRSQLVRGTFPVNVFDVDKGGRIVELTRELALATNSPDVEVQFSKKPKSRLLLDAEVQPFGPTAPLRKMDLASIKIDHRIEKAYGDTDLPALEAVLSLYNKGIYISKIQRAFSVGAFGLKRARRFVPTRWSITAVDSMISNKLIDAVKSFPLINEYRVYESWELDNRFIVLMLPHSWCYELIEAWYPRTIWNPRGLSVVMFADHEGYGGRSTYARIGGCYYAARLATAEALTSERRQAGVVILREAHPGYIMPVGVWNVRENVRNALKSVPRKFNTLREALAYISTRIYIKMKTWVQCSELLKDALYQRRIEDYIDIEKMDK